MTTVSPPPPPQPPSGGSSPASTATLVTPSAEIANLARGTNIEGVVLATLGKNQLQVQTVYGTVVLQTTAKIPLNSVITLTLSQLQPQPILQISGLNGAPLPGASALQSANPVSMRAQASSPNTSPTPSGQTPTLSVGVSTSATLVRPATAIIQQASTNAGATGATPSASSVPAAATANATAQQAPNIGAQGQASGQGQGQGQGQSQAQSTGLPGKAVNAPAPAPTNAPGQPTLGQATPQGQAAPSASGLIKPDALSATPRGTPNPSAGGPSTSPQAPGGNASGVAIPSGSKFSANVIKIEAPMGGSLTPGTGPGGAVLTLARGTVMTGVVTGTTASNQPIIQLPSATIALDVKGGVALGSKITIEVSGDVRIAQQPSAAGTMMRVGMGEQFIKSNTWDSLNEALRAIQAADPNRFQQIIQSAIPQTGNKISSQILFFLSALRGGDLKNWLGDSTVRLIERERPNLISRLGGEFQAMAKLADEPGGGDWRMAMIPIYSNERIERIRLYQRQPKDKKEKERDGKRFILDFNLSNIGHMQIDGLVKPDGSRVDLIIRSEKPLGQNAQVEIAQIYNEAAELTGIGGGVAFQAAPGNFVEFPPMAVESNRDSIIV